MYMNKVKNDVSGEILNGFESDILAGFDIVPSDSAPHISLDKQRRFYLNTSARRLLDAEPYKRMAVAYNPSEKSLALIMTDVGGIFDISASNYNVDKRYYMSARHFSNKYGYAPEDAPYIFEYDRGSSDGSVFIFRLRQ